MPLSAEDLDTLVELGNAAPDVATLAAEVTLPVDQFITHVPFLGHAYDGIINGRVAMRVITSHHIPHDTGRFLIRLVAVVAHFVHTEQAAAMHGFEAVANVGQGPSYDHTHRVIDVGSFHLLLYIYRDDLAPVIRIFFV